MCWYNNQWVSYSANWLTFLQSCNIIIDEFILIWHSTTIPIIPLQSLRRLDRVLQRIRSLVRQHETLRRRDIEDKVDNLYGVVSDQNAEDSEMTYQALPNEIHVKDSPIAGQGLFAKENIDAMMYLGISHVVVDEEIMRTPLGGFVNHSEDPNCVKWYEDKEWGRIYYMKTIKPIKEGEELFLKYTFYKVS